MTPEDIRIFNEVTASLKGSNRFSSSRPGIIRDRHRNRNRRQLNTIHEGQSIVGGASRRGTRTRSIPPNILKKINEAKSSIKKVIHKIKIWDGYVFRVRTQPQLFSIDVKFGDLYNINQELRGNPQTVGDSLFLFSEWIKLKNERGILNGKSSLLNNDIINFIYEVSNDRSQTVQNETEYLSKTYFGFYTVFNDILEKKKHC